MMASVIKEWERTAFGVVIVLVLIGGGYCTVRIAQLFGRVPSNPVRHTPGTPVFSESAFAFLTEKPLPEVSNNNAFNTPYGIRNPEFRETPAVVREPKRTPEEKPAWKPAWFKKNPDKQANVPKVRKPKEVAPVPAKPVELNVAKKPPEPKPPPGPKVQEFIEYMGVMKSPGGHEFAFINLIKVTDGVKEVRPQYLQTGRPVKGFKIEAYDAKSVTLNGKGDPPTKLRIGRQLEVGAVTP